MDLDTSPKVFLLSPASAKGVRALQLASPRARFVTANRLRSPEGLPIGEAFCFFSALYFRGKMAYARRFAVPGPAAAASPILVIAPGFGLVPPEWPLSAERLRKLARTPVDPARRSYSGPLRRDARELAGRLPPEARVVLLGSIATGKYLDLLIPVFGGRLLFPSVFAGTGDMRRGALMLRAAASGEELDYAPARQREHAPRAQAQRESALSRCADRPDG